MDIVISVASKIAELLVVPIKRQIGYVISYNTNIQNLKPEVEKLTDARTRVMHSIEDARRKGEEIEVDVDKWLRCVDGVIERVGGVFGDESKKRCFMGLCPDLKIRYRLGKAAKEELKVIVDLQGRGKFVTVSYPTAPLSIEPVKDYEAFESRKSVLNAILVALKDGGVDMIGVYGMSGVGKTMLVKKVAEQVKEGRMFEEVVLAFVKQNPDLRRIQDEIADGLGFKLDAASDKGRASQLRGRLKKETKVLVILDDIWERLELEAVGIPLGSDHEGCKILMTSRNKNVLSREMGAKENFQVQVLLESEGWNLFEKMVGVTVENPRVQPVAAEVAKRCAGLPILLAAVARALKNEDLYAWKDALKQLKRFDKDGIDEIDARVSLGLELSYKALRDDEIKSLFLLCGQFPSYDIPILDLLKYGIGLDLFKQSSTLEEARNRLHKLVNELKASCLLLEGDKDGSVKMHDVVHSFAISVASRDHHVLTVADEFKEWPANDVLQQYTAISLPYRKIPDLPTILECPKLKSFLLLNKDSSLKIPDNFFRGMKELKVLDLTVVNLPSLPSSLQFLENLQTLCLDFCVLEDIAIVGDLKKLEVLSVVGSNIVCLPKEIGKLTRLLLLDLSNCQRLEVISPNVLSSLTRLEDLYMENSFLQWEAEGPSSQRNSASLSELKLLSNLITLDIQITDADNLPKDLFLFFQKLERFRIFIGDGWDWSGKYPTTRTLKLNLNTNIQLQEEVKMLLQITEDLHLQEMKGVKNILNDLDAQGFPMLKHLHIQNCPEIQHIINSIRMGPLIAFLNLDSLFIENLDNLEKICHGHLMAESLRNLRILKVEGCHGLKNLFSFSMARGLVRLEEITIIDCKIMEEIVADQSENDTTGDEAIEFTQLRKLTLQCLPRFSSFYSNVRESSVLRTRQKLLANDVRSKEIVAENELRTSMPLFNTMIAFPNLEDLKLSSIKVEKIWHDQSPMQSPSVKKLASLVLENCSNLNYLFLSSMVESLAQLKRLEICNCKFMEEIVIAEGIAEGKMISKMLFPKLNYLKLNGLPKLTSFCTSNLLECPSLKVLGIGNCPELKKFISIPLSSGIPGMSKPETAKSALFDEKVVFPDLEELRIFEMDNLEMIWHDELQSDSFCKLKALKVERGKNLLNIFPSNMLRRFYSLEILIITDCDSVEEVFNLQPLINVQQRHAVTATPLRAMCLWNLPHLKHVWNKDPQGILSTHNLCSVSVFKCPSLKSLFPASVALDLLQLEELEIDTCGVEEIVAKDEGLEAGPGFFFPKVTSLKLWELPNLRRFYPGKHTSEWPRLKKLRLYHCDKMEIFPSEIKCFKEPCREDHIDIQGRQPLLSFRKIIPNLEQVPLKSKDATALLQGQFPQDFFHNLKALELLCFHDACAIFPFDLLPRFHNMEKLLVECSLFKELFPRRLVGVEKHARILAQIQHLELNSLPHLKHLWKSNSQLDQALQTLGTLVIQKCESLIYLAPSYASFQNLTDLHVSNCKRLVNLLTSTTARSLVQLTIMSIKECIMVTEVVANKGNEIKDEIIFSKLKTLELHCLPSLASFCSEKHSFEFPSLVEVVVRQCPEMKFFSKGILSTPKLQRVKLTEEENKGCWDGNLNTTIQQLFAQMVGFCGLQSLKLSEFPRLKDIWHSELPGEFFSNLRSLMVEECAFVSNVIPANLLLFLNNLEEIDVRNCDSLEGVFDLKGLNAYQRQVGLLSKLNSLCLIDLPRLRHVWNENPQGILDFRNLKLLNVHNCRSLRNMLTPTMASVLVQLKDLEVKGCPVLEEIITNELAGEANLDEISFSWLNSITLESLPNLRSFYSGKSVIKFPDLKMIMIADCPSAFISTFLREQEQIATDGATERKAVFPNLKDLKLSLINVEKLWQDHVLEMSSSFQNLTSLIVDGCGRLKYVLSPSMVTSLEKLKNLEICNCKTVEEIIVADGLGEERISNMLICELDFLKLKDLPKLARFCTSNLIECPALKSLWIQNCPQLRTFISSSINANVTVNSVPEIITSVLFDEKVALRNLEKLQILNMDDLERIWHNELHSDSFSKLKVLKVEHGRRLLNIFPSSMLGRFQNLEELHIIGCDSLEEVLDLQVLINVKDTQAERATQLRTMCLWNLPSLKNVWNNNPQGTLAFENLVFVSAFGCPNLKSIFPASIARALLQLEKLEIENCGVEEIIAEDGVEAAPRFVFPNLTSVDLWNLPELKRLYPGIHISEWPALKNLRVFGCDKLEMFASEFQSLREPHMEEQFDAIQQQPLLSFEKVIPNLEELPLDSKNVTMILHYPADQFCKVEVLHLQCFLDSSMGIPSGLIQRFLNVEQLIVRESCFEDLFSYELLNGVDNQGQILARLEHLTLDSIHNLKHIWKQEDPLNHMIQNLEALEVWCCDSLVNLAPPAASFQNLATLDVRNCSDMMNLVSSSAAKSMVHLTKMRIEECDVVTEIVSNEGNEMQDEIIFFRLESLALHCLPRLASFCSANQSFKFPSLTKVVVRQCPNMKVFSNGIISTPKLQGVQLLEEEDKARWNGNLNATIQQLFIEMT